MNTTDTVTHTCINTKHVLNITIISKLATALGIHDIAGMETVHESVELHMMEEQHESLFLGSPSTIVPADDMPHIDVACRKDLN